MMVLTQEDLFVHARRLVTPLLSPSAESMMMSMMPELTSIYMALKRIFESLIPGHQVYVTTAGEFVASTSAVFNDHYSEHFLRKAAWFDGISGCDGSSTTVFLQLESLDALLERVARGIASTVENTVAAEFNLSPTASAAPPPTAHPSPLPQISPLAPAGTSVQDAADSIAQQGSPHCPIIDIKLSGSSIRAAWRANALTKGIEDAAVAPIRQDSSWAPSHTTRLAVYHSTPGPYTGDHELALALAHFDTASQVLRGSVSPNQVAPVHSSVPVVWTSFNPFRSFLWASFVSEVLSDVPPTNARLAMSRSYDCPRQPVHSHHGVRLLEFRPRPFNCDEQRVYVMPNGIQDQWCRLATRSTGLAAQVALNSENTSSIWDIFSQFHGTSGECWPEVIHCHEVTAQSTMLRPFSRQPWRTVWHGAGIQELHRGRERIFSISFEVETPSTTTSKPTTIATSFKGETLGVEKPFETKDGK